MIGKLLLRIRRLKQISQTRISKEANIDISHITHIEKGERTPSHTVLKKICNSLDVPYQQIMYTYDKELTEGQLNYDILDHIAYNSVPAIDKIDDMIYCPSKFGGAAFALKVPDSSMEPRLIKGTFAYVEPNSPLNHNDIGLFYYKNNVIIRKFVLREDTIILSSLNKNFEEIYLKRNNSFYIIGKILGTNDDY